MAYSLGDRFQRPPTNYRLLEPGSYQNQCYKVKTNKAPFLSNTPRITHIGNRIWTHKIYKAEPKIKIQNCTSLISKKPRFPYEALSKEDIESILCRCGLENVCECSDKNEVQEPEVICQAKIQRKLFKGPTPKSGTEGLSVPSHNDTGFQEQPDGTYKRMFKVDNNEGPPFYNAEVIEATRFYRGWKWSQWKSSRATKAEEERPGPADYSIIRPPNEHEICAEKIKEEKRKCSKQLRYLEIIHERNLREHLPGPATYSPKDPKGPELIYFGPKAERFRDTLDTRGPGPAAYGVRRDFDPQEPPKLPCLARLPEPSCFLVKANRFKTPTEVGPSAASYDLSAKQCNFLNCSKAPFGSTAIRFKPTVFENDYDSESDVSCENLKTTYKVCSQPTWEFKSKTIRMHPLKKKQFEQSPADLPLKSLLIERPRYLQRISPFCSSEGRFQPWYDWLPVFAQLKTPGPGYYSLEKYRCLPAIKRGPLFRAERFPTSKIQTPAPNEYNVGGGVETVLATHNKKLKNNIAQQHKFQRKPPYEAVSLSLADQETLILEKTIAAFDENPNKNINRKVVEEVIPDSCVCNIPEPMKPKLLRSFLYRHPVKPSF